MLPHLLANAKYAARYLGTAKAEGEYRIFDNGVAEGLSIPWSSILRAALEVDADEVVLPDVMCSRTGTLDASAAAASKFQAPQGVRYAGVVQGQNFSEWQACLNAYVYHPQFKDVQTLMFPRCMNTSAQPRMRFHFVSAYVASPMYDDHLAHKPDLQIHCLGASSWIKEVIMLASLKQIRSIDTCMPIAIGLEGYRLDQEIYVRRQEGYFDLKFTPEQEGLVKQAYDNCRVFREWAGDRSLATGETTPASEV